MTQNRWPKRLLISSAVLLLISSIIIWTNWDDFVSAMDPENNNVARVEGGEEESVELSDGRTYIAYRLDSSATNLTIIESQTGAEVGRSSPGILQGDRFGEDDKIYTAVGVYNPEADGLHLIQNHDPEFVLWLVDSEKLTGDNSSLLMLEGGCFGIICGVCLIPIAGILWLTSRKTAHAPGLVMETADGTHIPLAVSDSEIQQCVPTTDEVWASVHGGIPIDLSMDAIPVKEDVPPPFADRPDNDGHLPLAIDEIEEIEEIIVEESDDRSENVEQGWKSWDEG